MIYIYHRKQDAGTPLTVDQANGELASHQYEKVARITCNSLLVAEQRSNYQGWITKARVSPMAPMSPDPVPVRPTKVGDILERDGRMYLITQHGFVSMMTLETA